MIDRQSMNVVHIFPYSPMVSGGHSNAIIGFIRAQMHLEMKVVAIAPTLNSACPSETPSFPFALEEFDDLKAFDWDWIALRFGFEPVDTVIHIHTIHPCLANLLRSLQIQKVPYVVTSHGQLHFRNLMHWAKKFIYLNLLNRDFRKAAAIHFLTGDACRRSRWLLPMYCGQRFVQPHALELSELDAARPLSRSDFGIPDDAFLWLFLGRLDVHVKGLDLLLEAFSRLDAKQNWLIFAGPDWHGGKARLERLSIKLRCQDRILFPGPIFGNRKWGLFKMADSFASPSRWDAFPVAILEAMACGLPIVSSEKMGPAKELFDAGAARICKLHPTAIAREMALVSNDSGLRKQMGERAKEWVVFHCSPSNVGSAFRQVYSNLSRR